MSWFPTLPLLDGLLADVLVKGAGGGVAFSLVNAADTWQWWHYPAWLSVILLGLEFVAAMVHVFGRASKAATIRPRGKHLDEFTPLDRLFVAFNRCSTAVFTYHAVQYLWYAPWGGRVAWGVSELGLASGLGALVAQYVVYDLFYTVFHRVLHLRGLYKHIHKHHHRQKAPTRGNADAVNVHPLEFLGGEYNHLLALHLVSRYVVPVHVVSAGAFIVAGGFFASLNHTRFDIRIPFLYEVRYHDIHHWYPECNYGQYTMLWDWVMGSLKAYPAEEDRGERKRNLGGGVTPPANGARSDSTAAENKEKAG
ncbi:conserved unknown protein [Ectocarpus siliculosus]|uniref:Fatty acid hydroxylase domain-containing protein n=1 Tax=Ectocarpus siliculosus TaxID=2880 RepID=D7G2Q4_ECTSI|nr:conserved unknown protein [Ectocarpus siliculosus]|eukprot:CBJ26879.1 conserved unknown protein [Ectocarpus siliculosus]